MEFWLWVLAGGALVVAWRAGLKAKALEQTLKFHQDQIDRLSRHVGALASSTAKTDRTADRTPRGQGL